MGTLCPYCPRTTCAAAQRREYRAVCTALKDAWDEKATGKPCPFYKRRGGPIKEVSECS